MYILLTEGAGVGKSHVEKCIYHEASKLLVESENPHAPTVLLTAPTGTAAFNINGVTFHSAFKLPIQLKRPYQPLGDDLLTRLRFSENGISSVKILIIDEISMVNRLMFAHTVKKTFKTSFI